MNLNSSTSFLAHGNSDNLMHHQHSPQFADNMLVHDESEVFEIESSNSIASEFIQPKYKINYSNYNHQHQMNYTSSPKKDKELNLSDYFKSLQM